MSDNLQDVFEAAHYRVFLNNQSVVLHIGMPCPPPVAQWLFGAAGTRCGWLITAFNPRAEPIDEARNRARHTVLRSWAKQHGVAYLDTVNEDPNGDWPDEPGLLLAGVEDGTAHALGRRFEQAAIVAVCPNTDVALVWLDIG